MTSRPHVLLSVATSLDGYIDDTSGNRLRLSNDDDFDRVDQIRAGVDAVLVGAETIRADNPRLVVRSAERQQQRMADGLPGTPVKITFTGTGDLDPGAKFFTTGDNDKLVYTTTSALASTKDRLGAVATVMSAGDPLDVRAVLADLADRKIEHLMVEGGGAIHTLFLTAGVVDELHLVYAPFFVGRAGGPRFVNPGTFPQDSAHRMTLAETRQIGDVVFLRYLPRSDRD